MLFRFSITSQQSRRAEVLSQIDLLFLHHNLILANLGHL